jgi:membrane-associated phospholipid phosphatase
LILSSLSNIVLKRVINRDRPLDEHLVDVATLSFPSGHSMSAMAFYGFLLYLNLRFASGWIKIILMILLLVIIVSVGLSRIYLGVHFPSDVLAGFIGGFIWINFSIVVFQIADLLRKNRPK